MKILYLTDTHFTAKNPSSRIDVFETVTYEKMLEIKEIINQNHVDFVLHGGDFFHQPRVSLRYTGRLAQILKSWGVPIFTNIGNHDIFGYSKETLDQTTLGLLDKTNIVEIIDRENPKVFNVGNKKIAIESQEYYKDIDHFDNYIKDYRVEIEADYNILLIHSMLLDKPFIDGVPHTVISDVETDADMVLVGHYHPGFTEKKLGNTTFINPGSTLRVESSRKDMPKVLIIDLQDINGKIVENHEYIYLKTAKSYEEVFDTTRIENKTRKSNIISEFKNSIKNLHDLNTKTTAAELLKEIGNKNNINHDVINKALDILSKSEECSCDEEENTYKELIEKDYELFITKVEINNFQSYKHKVINFTKGLNVITGESGNGKTAILRAIYWCLFNEPKGNDFIRANQNKCSVKITFNDGTSIVRERTKSSSGTYEIIYPDGTNKILKGFGSEVPIDVYNAHQMLNITLSKGKKSKLNFANQLDGPFLLNEPVSVKASAIGRLIGAQTLDIAIKSCSKQILDKSKERNLISNLLKEENDKLDKLDNIEAKRNALNQIEAMIEDKSNLENMVLKLSNFNRKLNSINNDIESLNARNEKLSSICYLLKYIDSLTEKVDKLDYLNSLSNKVKYLDKLSNEIKDALSKKDSIDNILSEKQKLIDLKELIGNLEYLSICNNKLENLSYEVKNLNNNSISDIYINKISDSISSLEKAIEVIAAISKYSNALKDKDKELNSLNSKLSVTSNFLKTENMNIDEYENKLSKLVSSFDICPVCNQKIKIESEC